VQRFFSENEENAATHNHGISALGRCLLHPVDLAVVFSTNRHVIDCRTA